MFDVADAAMKALGSDLQSQCIVMLGDSGSGKTESAKMVRRRVTRRAAAPIPCRARVASVALYRVTPVADVAAAL